MKAKNILWVITAIVAVVSIATAIAVIISRYLDYKEGCQYIECDCSGDGD